LISLVIIEISAFFAYTPVFGKRLTRDSIKVELLRGSIDYEPGNATDQKYADFVENKVLHPYLGFVYKPLDEQNDWQNFYGFHGGKTLQKKSPDKVIVAVSGGSFALGLINDSTDTLIREIKKIPQYNDKAIEVVGIAIGGFKQPQQLMTLSYLLSQGAEFDVWINLDGFNEITLPIVENYLAGVSLSYPRLWKLYAKKAFDRDTLDIMANIHSVKRSRENHKKNVSAVFMEQSRADFLEVV
jgi:hypothetical protein